ncbi:putative rRNA maturation factor [Acetoanaerobium pronyense]|uniref:Endoribonuclease YbeY n=1 Tax=Acetoanaerobium pronyense TaxID=1482736 RepID=A0ABS4KI98_9FIRM|nr:rRNA maturation RNase YbeY [Acetoanaerobium pronyense]MBP2026344.1 putative rRNA maturation factor [Acetoanaerobium pronyense]
MNLIMEDLQDRFSLDDITLDTLEKVIQHSLEEEEINYEVEVSLTLVDNLEIKELNNKFRGMDKSTDVLSFPMYEKHELKEMKTKNNIGEILIGDIVLSLEKASEQAEEYGHSFEREISFLICHSMFHLLGYDHDTEENEKVMRIKEEKVLKGLGIVR